MASFIGSFDPELKKKKYQSYQAQFGAEKVILIQRSSLFLFLKIIGPLLGYFIAYIAMIATIRYITGKNSDTVGYIAIIGLLGVLSLFLTIHLKRILDYIMDFIIVTPEQIIAYNQTGIRKRSNRTIDIAKVKSISVNYRGRIFSLFNNGDITFLSEGDNKNNGEIQAYYVAKPQKTKEKIDTIKKRRSTHTS